MKIDKKILKRRLIELLAMFSVSQFVMIYINANIFNSFQSWISGTIFGCITGMIMAWESRGIAHFIREKISWLNNPLKSAILTFTFGSVSTVVSIFILNYIFLVLIYKVPYAAFMQPNWSAIKLAIILYLSSSFIAHAIVFYVKWKNLAIEQEKQKTESLKLRFEALRNHVNPHFLFNSLSTLTHLIELDNDKAIEFTNLLSENYRFIIDTKDKDLVPLDEEIAFVDSYLRLQSIRYGKMVEVQNRITNNDSFQVIPVSVQMLIENVFKHNVISKDSKIVIELWIENDYLYVKNNINIKTDSDDRTPTGLANIRARYKYLSDHDCVFGKQGNEFVVALPLLKN